MLIRFLRSLQSKPPHHARRVSIKVRVLSSTYFAIRQSAVLITFAERQHSLSIRPIVRNRK